MGLFCSGPRSLLSSDANVTDAVITIMLDGKNEFSVRPHAQILVSISVYYSLTRE